MNLLNRKGTMSTQEAFRIEWEMTQEEMDACILMMRMPYQEENGEAVCKASFLCHIYEDRTGRRVESKVAEELLFGCMFSKDYSPAVARAPECRRIVESLYDRAGFEAIKDA